MLVKNEFLRQVLDEVSDLISVIDETGAIKLVNANWHKFAFENDAHIDYQWCDQNYLAICDHAAQAGDNIAKRCAEGIRSIFSEEQETFSIEYPCHEPTKKRWFMLKVTKFESKDKKYAVLAHQDITEKVSAVQLSIIDDLTRLENRRGFDINFEKEWRRAARLKQPISLAMIDLDHFKQLNDLYGHQTGDQCLMKIGKLLKASVPRSGDIAARYGGEEFVVMWLDTPLHHSKILANKILKDVFALQIENPQSTQGYLTASIGLVSLVPTLALDKYEIVLKADNLLYQAKNSGRNKIESQLL